jgi:hypothetical protein
LVSPFLPAFLAARGLAPEELGLVLSTGTAVRLIGGPIAGRLADRYHIFRAELAIAAALAAIAGRFAVRAFAAGRDRSPADKRVRHQRGDRSRGNGRAIDPVNQDDVLQKAARSTAR